MLKSNSIRHNCFPNHQFHKSVQKKKTRRNHRVMQLNSVWLKYHKIGNETIQINITQAVVLELCICLTQINCTKYWFAYWTHSKHMFFLQLLPFGLHYVVGPKFLAFLVHMSVWCSVFHVCTKFVYIHIIYPSSLHTYIHTCTPNLSLLYVCSYISKMNLLNW